MIPTILKSLRNVLPLLGILLLAAGNPGVAAAQSKSMALAVAVPASVKLNTTVTIHALLTDAWHGTPLVSRPVLLGVGDEFSLSSAGKVFTSNQGLASVNWRFTRRGIFRIVAFVDNGSGYLSQRTTVFIQVY